MLVLLINQLDPSCTTCDNSRLPNMIRDGSGVGRQRQADGSDVRILGKVDRTRQLEKAVVVVECCIVVHGMVYYLRDGPGT